MNPHFQLWATLASLPGREEILVCSFSQNNALDAEAKGKSVAQKQFGIEAAKVQFQTVELVRGTLAEIKSRIRMSLFKLGVPAEQLDQVTTTFFRELRGLMKRRRLN